MVRSNEFTVAGLFSGAGLLDLGFEMAGFQIAYRLDSMRAAIATLHANQLDGTLGKFGEASIPDDIFLYLAGIPCQAFSTGSQATGHHGTKHVSAPMVKVFTEELGRMRVSRRPEIVVVENARGWFTKNMRGLCGLPDSAWGRSKLPIPLGPKHYTAARLYDSMMTALGYRTDFWLLRADNYGNPQHRYRMFAVSNRIGLQFEPPVPTHDVSDGLTIPTLQSVLHGREGGLCGEYTAEIARIITHVPPGETVKGIDPATRRWLGVSLKSSQNPEGVDCRFFRRTNWAGKRYKAHGDRKTLYQFVVPCTWGDRLGMAAHPDEDRPFSVSECAALQGFPDDYHFMGSLNQQYKQIGNAVPLEMAYAVGMAVMRGLKQGKKSTRGNLPTVVDVAGECPNGNVALKPLPRF